MQKFDYLKFWDVWEAMEVPVSVRYIEEVSVFNINW